ncbi:MAG: hypothetical protein AAFP02_12970 [Bacteroidota bacterium]
MAELSISHYLIWTAGVLHMLLVVLHLYFPRLLHWEKYLPQIDKMNRSVYLTIHWMLILWLGSSGLVLLFGADILLSETSGMFLLALVGLQWVLRLIFQWVFFHPWRGEEKWLTIGFVLLIVCSTVPIVL